MAEENVVPFICSFFKRPQLRREEPNPLRIFYGDTWSAYIYNNKHLVYLEHDPISRPMA